jgi:hypothetical protein
MSTDEYNGWTNRETWALNLWLTNDQGLYELTRERVAAYMSDEDDTYPPSPAIAGEAVKSLYAELTDPSEGLQTVEQSLKMVSDIGSDYRVNWDEIGAYWLSDLSES